MLAADITAKTGWFGRGGDVDERKRRTAAFTLAAAAANVTWRSVHAEATRKAHEGAEACAVPVPTPSAEFTLALEKIATVQKTRHDIAARAVQDGPRARE